MLNVQIVDNLALVPLTQTEVATQNLNCLGVISITSSQTGGNGDMMKSVFATINPAAGYVDKALTSTQVPYTGITSLPGGTTLFLRADGSFAAPPGQVYSVVSTNSAGLAPVLPPSSGFNFYLRGDGQWVALTTLTVQWDHVLGTPSTFPAQSHAASHLSPSGTDPMLPPTTLHTGIVPILPALANQSINFLRGDGNWSTLPSVSNIVAGLIPAWPGGSTLFFRADGTYSQPSYNLLANVPLLFEPVIHGPRHTSGGTDPIPNFSIGGPTSGLTPGSPGDQSNYLRADGTWHIPPGQGTLADSFGPGALQTLPALPASNQQLYYLAGDNFWHRISNLSISFNQIPDAPIFAGGSAGLVPNAGGAGTFLRVDGTWSIPSGGPLADSTRDGLVRQLPGSNQGGYYLRGDNSWVTVASLVFSWSQINPATYPPTGFTPAPHAGTHQFGGTDVIGPATLALTGLVPRLPASNQTASYLRGDSSWSTIPTALGATGGLVPDHTNQSNLWFNADSTFKAIPNQGVNTPGLAPGYPNNIITFLRGDGGYSQVDWANLVNRPSQFDPIGHNARHITGGTDQISPFSAISSGLVPIGLSDATKFLCATGSWSTPAGAGDVSSTRQINTQWSLTGGGDLTINRTHNLVGDVAAPAAFRIYSTDAGQNRGWNALSIFPLASISSAGLVPTLPTGSDPRQFLSGSGSWATPPAFTAALSGSAPASGGGTLNFLRADGQWQQPPTPGTATTLAGGIVPTLQAVGVQSQYYLRGDDTWQTIAGISISWSQIPDKAVFSGTATNGLVPGTSGGLASVFLRGDGAWQPPPRVASAIPGTCAGLQGSNQTAYWHRGDDSWQFLPSTVFVSSPWTMPSIGGTVNAVSVSDSSMLQAGMTVMVLNKTSTPSTYNAVMEIAAIASGVSINLTNRGSPVNPAPGTQINGGILHVAGPGVATGVYSGLVPTPPSNDSTKYLNGAGAWTVPPGGITSVNSQFSISGDGSSGSKLQLVNDTSSPGPFRFYSTDAVGNRGWLPLAYSWETDAEFTMPGVGGTQPVTLITNDGQTVGSTIVIEDNSVPPTEGFLEVMAVNVDGIHITVKNPGYAMNATAGAVFAVHATVTLAGPAMATATTPGFVPTPPLGDTTKFLGGDATWYVPPTVSEGGPGYAPTLPSPPDATQFLDGAGNWSVPSVGVLANTSKQGAVAKLDATNQSGKFLRGDNSWAAFSELIVTKSQVSDFPSKMDPNTHAGSHVGGQPDAIADFSTNSTVSGLVPGSNSVGTNYFLRADGQWATTPGGPSLATTGADGLLKGLQAVAPTTYYLQGDNTWALKSGLTFAWGQITSDVPDFAGTYAPKSHKATHLDNGTDPIDVVAGSRTGLVPVLPTVDPTLKYLCGNAQWAVVPAATNLASGLAPILTNNQAHFLRGDGSYTVVPTATSTTAGLVPAPNNRTYEWLRGDATFSTIPFYWNISASFTQPAVNAPVSVTFTDTTGLVAGMCVATIDTGTPPKTNIYSVSSVTNSTTAVLTNLGATGNTSAASTVNAGQANLNGPPLFTATGAGIVPNPTGTDATYFLRADGIWAVPPASGVQTTRIIATQYSITGGGDLSSNRTLNLVGDTSTPTAWQFYGVNGATPPVRGWYSHTQLPVATLSNAGLLPTLGGGTTNFLRADGTWNAPSGLNPASGSAAGIVPQLVATPPNVLTSGEWLRGDNTWAFPPNANTTTSSWTMPAVGANTASPVAFNSTANWKVGHTLFFATGNSATCCFMEITTMNSGTTATLINRGYISNPVSTTVIPTSMVFLASPGITSIVSSVGYPGLVPKPPNTTNTFLRGDATFAQVDYSNLASAPNILPSTTVGSGGFTQPAVGATVNALVASSTGATAGLGVFITSGGYYSITAVPDPTHITIFNAGHALNAAPGAAVNTGDKVYFGYNAGLFSGTVAGDVPKSTGTTTDFLCADGTWKAPPGGSVSSQYSVSGDGTSGNKLQLTNDASAPGNWQVYSTNGSGVKGWNAGTALPVATATVSGLVPTPPNDTGKWLRGDSTWVIAPPLTITAVATFTWPAFGGTVAIQVIDSSLMIVGMGLYFKGLGTAEVTVITDGTHITIRNNGITGNLGSTAGVAIGTPVYAAGCGGLATASTTGMIPLPNGSTTTFLNANAAYVTPPSVGTSAPGYCPTAPNNAAQFLNGASGTWTTPPSATATVAGYVPTPPNDTSKFLRGDATFTVIPTATATVGGLVPTPPNDTAKFMRGDATFTVIPAATSTVTGLVPTPPNNAYQFLRGDATWTSDCPLTVTTTGTWTWPAAAASATGVKVGSSTKMMVGGALYFAGFGTAEITAVTDGTTISIRNNNNSGNLVAGTVAIGTTIYACGAGSLATTSTSGVVPAGISDTTKYLRSDMSWQTVAATGGGTKTYAVFNALQGNPPATLYATFNTRNSIPVLEFDAAATWTTVFIGVIPEAAVLTSGLKVRLHWMGASATSGNVRWNVAFERMTTDEDADSFDTAVPATGAANGTSGIITVTEITVTTIDSVAAGDGFRLSVQRLGADGADTMTANAQLVLCEVRSAA